MQYWNNGHWVRSLTSVLLVFIDNLSTSWGSGSNNVAFTVPPITAITDFVEGFATVSSDITSNDLTGGPQLAEGKDLCIVFANA